MTIGENAMRIRSFYEQCGIDFSDSPVIKYIMYTEQDDPEEKQRLFKAFVEAVIGTTTCQKQCDWIAHKKESRRRIETILEWYGIPYVDNATTRRYINCPEPHDATNKRHFLISAVQKRVEDYECIISKFLRQEMVILDPDAYVSEREFIIALRIFISESDYYGVRPSQEQVFRKISEYGIIQERCTKVVRGRDVLDDFLIGVGLRDRDDNELF